MKLHITLVPLFAVAALAYGSADAARLPGNDRATVRASQDRNVGVVESIGGGRESRGNDSALLGTVVGGVAGAAAGHQVGKGRTRRVATVAGALGGAVIGRKIDKRHDRRKRDEPYVLGIRLNDGDRETVTQNSIGGLRVGDRVRIQNGRARKL